MGVISFIKEAGLKAFGKKTKSEEALTDPSEIENAKRQLNKRTGASLIERIEDLGLEAQDLNIAIDGEKAIITGNAKNQSTKEKITLVVGNVEGISEVDDQMKVAENEPESSFYTVKSGDTLSIIAKQFYSNPMKYPVIFEANKPMLKDPDKIYPGQVLRVPKVD